MAALTEDRNTPRRDGELFGRPVAADTAIFAGAMVARDVDGNALPAADAAGLVVLGRSEHQVDNSGGEAGDKTVRYRRGVFGWDKSAENAPTAEHIGTMVFVEDDQTVTTNAGEHMVVAGLLVDVDDEYAWVETPKGGE